MTINLYYIEGISRIDTPYFATKTSQATLSKQEEFFDSHIVQSVELSYYPPHYRNVIKFDEEDLTIKDNVNYLSLEYKDKRYYYFIDSINYVSESIIEIEITMDVIQTYMFDIYISNGVIERKFINRFDSNNKIVRTYVRENLSNNEFVYKDSYIINDDIQTWLVFAITSKYYDSNQTNTKISYDVKLPGADVNNEYLSAYPFYILPYVDCKNSGTAFYTEAGPGEFYKETRAYDMYVSIYNSFNFLASRNWVVDMYICPFNSAKDLTITYDNVNHVYRATFANTPLDFFISQHNSDYSPPDIYNLITLGNGADDPSSFNRNFKNKFKCKVGVYSTTTDLDVTKNTTLSKAFNPKYITQMLDENYIRFKFGSLTAFTSIPLFYLTSDALYCYYAFMPTDGTRVYWLGDSSGNDLYNTVVQDTNVLHFDLKNDPWVTYQSQNRSRYVAAGLNTAVTLFSKGAMNSLTSKFATQEIMDIKSNPKNYDKRYKVPQLKSKPSRMVTNREQDIERANLSTGLEAISGGAGIGEQLLKDANIALTPAEPKQIANISAVCAKQAYIMTYTEYVNDFNQCAQYYHRNGFLVNEYINAKSDIFAYVFNRYYFNILKMSLPNVHLHHVIEDEDTIEAITDRLIDGVRLWNVRNTGVVIGDFQYDNVENDYLS